MQFNKKISLMYLFFMSLVMVSQLIAGSWYGKDTDNLAVITTPVVDLFVNLPVEQEQPAAAVGQHKTCRRAHQGLYNEVVQCVEQQGDCVRIACDNLFYGVDEQNKLLNTFWINQKHLMPLQALECSGINLEVLPAPVEQPKNNTAVVLTFMWNDYSLGTRFARAAHCDTSNSYGAYVYNPDSQKTEIIQIPHTESRIENPQSPQEARATFVTTLNNVLDRIEAMPNNQVLAYVWGGSSATYVYNEAEKTATADGKWVRPHDATKPYSGYDCSELVLRIAQTSGLTYPFKTTGMLEKFGQKIEECDQLHAGDLVWIPGHVSIVNDIEKNTLAEARGYDSGYGKAHRIPLSAMFKDIATYATLRAAYHEKKPLILLKKDGTDGATIPNYHLIKLPTQV